MTIAECSKYLKLELENCEINNPQLEAESIIEHFLNVDKKYLIINKEKEIDKKTELKIKKALKKRKKNYPLAYIKNEKYFYKSKFFVNKNVLIPRPESELIIDEIIKNEIKNTSIIDVGTGSGCLIISILKELNDASNNFYGLDISNKALKIARYNSKINNVEDKIIFKKSNLLNKVKEEDLKENIIIIANLPYLTREEIKKSKTIKAEPFKALYGGNNGLGLYRKLLTQTKKLKNKKNHIEIYMEISDWQKDYLLEIVNKDLVETKTIKDFLGQNRLIVVSL
ncbi:MAG: peptide chain release factor N(5)-glutamine methyltransferase [Patescibacteria group bacterium]